MITVTKQPPAIESFSDPQTPPVPLSDCLEWCLVPDTADVFTTPGAKAKIVFVIPAVCTVPADGTPFTVWGYDFTVDSSSDFTSESFKVYSTGLFTVVQLANMFAANIFFQRATVFTSFAIVGSNYEFTLEWRECREQPNFTGSNMDLAVFSAIGGSATPMNGISPVYVDAYRLLVRGVRWTDATGSFIPLSPFAGLDVEKLCTTVGEMCLELNQDIGADLYTMLPALTDTSFISAIDNGRSMMRYYSLEYGSTYRANCVPKSGTILRSDRVLVLNAAFDIDDPYQIRRYWNEHPDGFPSGQFVPDFLTTQPKQIPLCTDSFKWLWLLNHWQDSGFGQYSLIARWVVYDSTGAIVNIYTEVVNDPATMGSSSYQAVCFNASPGHLYNVLGANPADVACYEIQVIGVNPLDHDDVYFNASEYLKFCPGHCCDNNTDLYFLSPTGSIDTVVVRVDSVETLQTGGQEINVQIACDSSRVDRATNGGRTLVAARVYQKVKLSLQIPRTTEWERWAKHIRQSPQRWIKVIDEGGTPIAKKIVFETGGIKVKETGVGSEIEFTGYLQDIPTQQGTEKLIL